MNKKLHKMILNTPDFEDAKSIRLFEIFSDVRKEGFFSKRQAIDILKWKSPRPLKHYNSNSESDFEAITKLAFAASDERLKIHILTALQGVKYPAASALLMFYDSANYPIIDIRVWKQLYSAGLLTTNARGQGFTLGQWIKYLEVIRKIASELSLTARQVEKRLFDINKTAQKGLLYKTYKIKTNRRMK